MHVNKTKKIAILGVFAALSTVFTVESKRESFFILFVQHWTFL